MKVWAIFSIANNYDQPDNNLEKLYKEKPTFEALLNFFYEGKTISDLDEYLIIGLVGILKEERVDMLGGEYRLELVEVE